jgi:outer membrane protein OmpA-like peptidoglycan-associated protein/tetratricopeptide (TPR) repeat protein
MKKGISILALVSSLFLGTTLVQAQAGLKTGNKQYENLAYAEAIKTYEHIAKKGYIDPELLKQTGNSYYFNGEYMAANVWYSKLFTDFESNSLDPEYFYRYAQTLKSIGDNQQAQLYFEKFAKMNPNSSRSALIKSGKKAMLEIEKNSGRYSINHLVNNSPYTDYPNSMHNGKLLFTSARDTGNFVKREFTWTGDSFTKLYDSKINEDGSIDKPSRLSSHVDTKFNESGSVITKDGKTMYFTRNNYNYGSRGFNQDNTTLLKIYKAELVNGKWTNIKALPFTSDQFNTAHPALNADESYLYFSSDRPGGYGSSDIWKVRIGPNGYSSPINLGPEVNTDGRETFPYINSDDELYFSSDGRPGLGGLDVYALKIKSDGTLTAVQNLGAPLNSEADDFAYIIDSTSKLGYFSSNRSGGFGKDDIYQFKELRALELECIQDLRIKIVDAKTGELLDNAELELKTSENAPKAFVNKSVKGYYDFVTNYECGESYIVKVKYPDYNSKEESITLPTESGLTERTIALERKVVPIEKGVDLFKVLELKPIHFDFDKSNIRPDAALELEKIVKVMKQYPNMEIDVRSFTDSRGNDAYNMKLSERRAKSTAEWIISQGISSSRVSYKGYGETHLLNNCSNGVKCTDAEHEVNRRSEFIVTEM